MGMSIKNAEVERMARELATRRGVSMTEAIRQSLREALEQPGPARRAPTIEERRRSVTEALERLDRMPRLTEMTADEIIGYDEHGLPR